MEKQTNIFFTGMPGSGKTFVATRVAKLLNIPFIDLDTHIVQKTGKTIPQLFQKGEAYFRRIEQQYLDELLVHGTTPFCLATGGGTVCYADNLQRIKSNGILVYIQCNIPVLVHRVLQDSGTRPLLQERDRKQLFGKLEQMEREREVFYLQSHLYHQPESESLRTFVHHLIHFQPD